MPAPAPRAAVPGRGLLTAAALALAVAALHYGREILIPLALAALLAFLLDPLVVRLRRAGVPRPAAIGGVLLLVAALLGATSVFVGSQLVQLGQHLPGYQSTIQKKLRTLRLALTGPGVLDDASRVLGVVEGEVAAARRALGTPRKEPMRVQVEPAPPSPLQALGELLAPVLAPLFTVGATFVFLVFMLIERAELRDRTLRLVGGDLRRTTDALNDAARRISRYLGLQLVVNLGYGLPLGLGLWLIGVPGAPLWGLLAALLRFIPYAGPVIGAMFPLLLAFAVDPGWQMLAWTLALVVLLELVSNNVVEPWLYGSSTGISPLALLVSAAFWAALWGPVGLMLATPLTVCLVVLGRHLKPMAFFGLLFGSDPVFDPPTRLYQRLLGGDVEEAVELADEQVRQGSLPAFCEHAALPALRLASADHLRLDPAHRQRVASGFTLLARELRELHPVPAAGTAPVACIGLRWELDSLAAGLLAHVLALEGPGALHLPSAAIAAGRIGELQLEGVQVVVLSVFNPAPQTHLRYVARRLKRRWPALRVLAAAWNAPPELLEPGAAAALEVDALATGFDEALRHVRAWLPGREPASALPCAALPDIGEPGAVERALQRAADVHDAKVAVLADAGDPSRAIVHGGGGPAAALLARVLLDRLRGGEALHAVTDLARDPALAGQDIGTLRFAAAAALRGEDGRLRGALCVMDPRPRELGADEAALLQGLADELLERLAAPSAT